MRCFHVPLCQISHERVRITGGEFHHLANVVRLRKGDEIIVLDGSGGIYEVALISCGRDAAVGEVRAYRQAQPRPVEVTLFVGLPKADKMDLIVQKVTELGAYAIVPILCRNTVPYLSAERAQRRIARWRQIVVGAAKQSHQPFFPFVSNVLGFDEALKSQAHIKLIFAARSAHSKLKDVLRENAEAKKVGIFIGPEGGFSEDEINRALLAGAALVSLGNSVLRTETAAIAALTIVLYEKDAAYLDD